LLPWTDRQRSRSSLRSSGSDYPTFGEEDIKLSEVSDIQDNNYPSRVNYNRDDEESKREWSDLQDKLMRTHPEDKLTYNSNKNDNRGRSSFDDDPPTHPIVYKGSSENQGSKEWFDKVDKLSDHRDRDYEEDRKERKNKIYRTLNAENDNKIANMYD
jgi:hypothetical protein